VSKHLQLVSTIVPLLIVAVGLIGWVFTLRADINTSQVQIIELKKQQEYWLPVVNESLTETQIEINKLSNQINELIEEVNNNSPSIEKLKRDLAIANDQMRTIMSDHNGFGDALKELGKASALPSGERRDYGGYGGY
jgi:peptidoglycan hydrolase CwlO-like protein